MQAKTIFALIFSTFSLIFLLRFAIVKQAVYGDGIYYWAYTRSIVMNHNLDLRDEGMHQYAPEANNNIENEPKQYTASSDLRMNKYYPIGTSLIFIPFFLLADNLAKLFHMLHFPIIQNGYADLYQIIVGLGNIALTCLGLVLLFSSLKIFFKPRLALITILAISLGTNLLYYSSLDVVNSHPPAFFLSSLLLFVWIQTRKNRTGKTYLLFGFLIGFMATIRTQDALFLAFLLPEALIQISKTNHKVQEIKVWLVRALWAFLGFFFGFLPQLIISKILYNSFFVLPYSLHGNTGFFLDGFHGLDIIFDPQRGLLFYSPLFILGIIGLFFFRNKEYLLASSSMFVVFLTYLTISVWSGWSQGEAFGMRMFISLYPFAALGLAEIIKKLLKRISFAAIYLILFFFFIQNMLMIANFHLFLHNPTYIGSELSESGKMKIKLLEMMGKKH